MITSYFKTQKVSNPENKITIHHLPAHFQFSTNAQTGVYVPELANFEAAMTNLMTKYNVPGGHLAFILFVQ